MAKKKAKQAWTDKQVFTTGEAEEICNVSQQTIIRCFDNGRLNGFRVPGSRFRKIPRTELLRFMKANDMSTEMLETKMRILVANLDVADTTTDVLADALEQDERFAVEVAKVEFLATVQIGIFRPHMIIMSGLMSRVNRLAMCKHIRTFPDLQHVRMMFVIDPMDHTEVESLMDCGHVSLVSKPFNFKELVERIATELGIVNISQNHAPGQSVVAGAPIRPKARRGLSSVPSS